MYISKKKHMVSNDSQVTDHILDYYRICLKIARSPQTWDIELMVA